MPVMLIGGNGFIGSHLAERLRAMGQAVTVLDPGPPRADVDWRGINYRRAAWTDADVLDVALQDCDTVVHLASSTVPSTGNADPSFDVQSNLIGALSLIDAMKRRGRKRIVFFSSGGTVYGNPDHLPVEESHALRPICSYGIVKAAIENYLLMYGQSGELAPLILRPSNPYGPRQSIAGAQGFIAAVMARLRNGQALDIWGDGGHVRDYLYIDDLVELASRAIVSDVCGVFNAGSGIGRTLNEVRAVVEQVARQPVHVRSLPARPFDVRSIVLDVAAARARFDWSPKVGIDEGVACMWQWLEVQGHADRVDVGPDIAGASERNNQ